MKSSTIGSSFFGLSFLLFVAISILQLRAKESVEKFDITLGIHSIEDYNELVDMKIFPMELIPDEAHRSIANSLVFNHQSDLIAGSFLEAKTFLNNQEQHAFLSLLFGAKVNIVDKDFNLQNNLSSDSSMFSNATGLFLILETEGRFQIITGV